ncbi:hypothetical protein COBT_000496 [Conglomerata obtusa]
MSIAIFVFGPAGTGKSTFTTNLYNHGQLTNRSFIRVNLDPGQVTDYEIDITNYITTEDVMTELDLGPNGSVLVALEEFYNNIEEIELETYLDSYLIVDCPGQIELYVHSEVMKNIVDYFQKSFRCCSVYLMEAQFSCDIGKYLSGCLCALIGMMRLNLPNFNIITKMDLAEKGLITNKPFLTSINDHNDELSDDNVFVCPDESLREYVTNLKGKSKKFYEQILNILVDNNMISFVKLNWEREEMISEILYEIDTALQYFDDIETKENFK